MSRVRSIQRVNLLHYFRRHTYCNRILWYIPRHHRARSNGATASYGHSRQHRNVRSEPAVVPNDDGLCVLDVVPPRLQPRLVRRCDEAHARGEEDAVADGNVGAVEDDGAISHR